MWQNDRWAPGSEDDGFCVPLIEAVALRHRHDRQVPQSRILDQNAGWMQLFAETNQEAVDLHIQAFRLARAALGTGRPICFKASSDAGDTRAWPSGSFATTSARCSSSKP